MCTVALISMKLASYCCIRGGKIKFMSYFSVLNFMILYFKCPQSLLISSAWIKDLSCVLGWQPRFFSHFNIILFSLSVIHYLT